MPAASAEARFRDLYNAHYEEVLRYALRRVGPDLAPDVTSEVFLVAWRRVDDVPTDRPIAWLIAIARNVVATKRRTQTRQDALLARATEEAMLHAVKQWTDPGGILETEKVQRALAALSDDDRELILLTAWEGLRVAEIATALGMPAARVSVRLHRAKRRLASALGAADRFEEVKA